MTPDPAASLTAVVNRQQFGGTRPEPRELTVPRRHCAGGYENVDCSSVRKGASPSLSGL